MYFDILKTVVNHIPYVIAILFERYISKTPYLSEKINAITAPKNENKAHTSKIKSDILYVVQQIGSYSKGFHYNWLKK